MHLLCRQARTMSILVAMIDESSTDLIVVLCGVLWCDNCVCVVFKWLSCVCNWLSSWLCVGVCVGVSDSGIDAELSNIVELEKEVEVVGKEGEIVMAEGLTREWEEDKGERVRDGDKERELERAEEDEKLWAGLFRKGEG